MQIIVTTQDDHLFPVDVAEDMTLEDFLAFCKHESDYLRNSPSSTTLSIFFNGRNYSNVKQTLKEVGLKSGDLVLVTLGNNSARPLVAAGNNPARTGNVNTNSNTGANDMSSLVAGMDFSSLRPLNRTNSNNSLTGMQPNNQASTVRHLFDQISRGDAQTLNNLRHNDPALAQAVEKKDFEKFSTIIKERLESRKQEIEKRRRIFADPLSAEAQQLMLQDIHRQQIDEHMQIALEHTPENFGVVHMLYVKCKVNGHDVKAFVDSGAQATIMSETCAKACNILHLVDKRFAGLAQGVGTSKIVGRIHLGQLQIGKDFLATSFTVLENQSVDLLLGLDMLRRHQCSIDLKRNKLVFGTTGGEADFLPESELPTHAKHHHPLNDGDESLMMNVDDVGGDEIAQIDKIVADSLKTQSQQQQPSTSSSGINSTTSNAATALAAAATPLVVVNDANVAKLMEMGFGRDDVVKALQKSANDVDKAAAILLANALAFTATSTKPTQPK